ncbi:PQQ-like beta-propeller repeat protein [soil metagenome]
MKTPSRHPNALALAALAALLAPLLASAASWPQYHGPHTNNVASEDFPSSAWGEPKVLWKHQTGAGFSSFAVAGGMAFTLFTQEIDGIPRESCVAYDATSGEQLWSAPLGIARYDCGGDSGTRNNKGGDGPRSTPSYSEGKLYALDARLALFCFDARSGELVWSRDIGKDHDGQELRWQNAASPLVIGDRLFLAGGGSVQALLALDKNSGKTLWAVGDDKLTHATPIHTTLHGTEQIIFFTQKGLVSVVPDSGTELWRYPFPFNTSSAASPVVWEDIVFCSAGYGVGAGAVRIAKQGDRFAATEIWRTPNDNINHWSTPIVHDGYLYGMFSFKDYGSGPLACVDIRTGKMRWKEKGFGPGNVILAGSTLLALSDDGHLVAAQASPTKYSEIGRAKILDGKCWSTPALADGKIYARSTEEAVCLEFR